MRSSTRAPRTPFSTELRGGPRTVKARLGNLFSPGKSRAPVLVAAALVLTVLAGGLVACNQTAPGEAQTPAFEGVPTAAVDFALDYIDAQIKLDDDAFTGGEPLSLSLSQSFGDVLTGAVLEVYALDYRLETGLTQAAGGAWLDDDGWYHDGWLTYLVLMNRSGTRSPLGSYVEIDGIWHDGGWYGVLGGLLISRGGETGDAAMVRDGQRAFFRAYLDRADAAMACFTGKAPSQGEPFTDEAGHTWLKFADYQDTGLTRLDDGILQELVTIFPRDLATRLFQDYVYVGDPVVKQFDDGLRFRQDSAEMLNWRCSADLSSLTVTRWDDQIRQGYAADPADDARWYFTLVNDGSWKFYQYYTLSDGGAEDWDFTFFLDGKQYAMGASETGIFGVPYGTTTTEPDENGVYYYTEWYGKGGSTGVTYAYHPERGSLALRAVATSDFTGLTTWRGVRLGDSMDAVRAAYPDGQDFSDSVNGEKRDYQLFQSRVTTPGAPFDGGELRQMNVSFYADDSGAVSRIYISDSRE